MLAHWGLDDRSDHAIAACQCALDCLRQRDQLAKQHSRKLPKLELRAGINTGSILIGNFVWGGRLQFTVVGETLNLTSRLVELTKSCSTEVLISEATRKRLPNDFAAKYVSKVKTNGEGEKMEIFALSLGEVAA
jgi:adenylate cyclase